MWYFFKYRLSINSPRDSFEISQSGLKLTGGENVHVKVARDINLISDEAKLFSIEERDCRFPDEVEVGEILQHVFIKAEKLG